MAGAAMTRLQSDVLWVVESNGPVTVRDVATHLNISEGSARGVLDRLDHRGLVDRQYTGTHVAAICYTARFKEGM